MNDSVKYIAEKSKELLLTQIDSYRALNQNAGIAIAVASLFAPFFVFLVEKAEFWIRIFSILLIIPLIIGIILLLLSLKSQKLNRGYDETNFEEFINIDIDEVFKNEIAYNKHSIEENDKILKKQNKKYNIGINFILISIILSIILLFIESTFKKDNINNNIIIYNTIMENEKKTTGSEEKTSTNSEEKKEKVITLPKIDIKKVKKLNEGIDPKKKEK